jgi:prevent-host-death family protein
MRSVNIGDLKDNLSRYLNEVRRGSEVVVKDRNKPIAKIIPLTTNDDDESELLELIAEGAARGPRTDEVMPKSFWRERRPHSKVDVSDIVRKDRDAR